MDTLSGFFERIRLHGQLFFAGRVDGTLQLDKPPGVAFIHVVVRGRLDMVRPGFADIAIEQPSVLFCPSSCRYQLRASAAGGCELICASFRFARDDGPQFALGLDETLVFPFAQLGPVEPVLSALIGEFHGEAPGRGKAIELLFEYLLVLLVRRAVADGGISSGLLFALQDGRLGRALDAMHRAPQTAWRVDQLAALAHMSRSAFAAHFTRTLGVSPLQYLAAWRMKRAQDLLCDGVPIKMVAPQVGYGSQAAFTRTFVGWVGQPPAEWLKAMARAPGPAAPR